MLVSIQLPPVKVKGEFKTRMSSFKPCKVDIAKGDLASNNLRLSQSVHYRVFGKYFLGTWFNPRS